jgi:hypothetical protein
MWASEFMFTEDETTVASGRRASQTPLCLLISSMPEQFLFCKLSPRIIRSAMPPDSQMRSTVALEILQDASDPLITPFPHHPLPATRRQWGALRRHRESLDAESDLRSFPLPQTCFPSPVVAKIVECLPV